MGRLVWIPCHAGTGAARIADEIHHGLMGVRHETAMGHPSRRRRVRAAYSVWWCAGKPELARLGSIRSLEGVSGDQWISFVLVLAARGRTPEIPRWANLFEGRRISRWFHPDRRR